MPRTQCCAPNCRNRGGFRFPTNSGLRKLWEAEVKRKDWTSTKSSVLCRDHFDPTDFLPTTSSGLEPMRQRLKKGALPKYVGRGENDAPGPAPSTLCDSSEGGSGMQTSLHPGSGTQTSLHPGSGTQTSLPAGTDGDSGPRRRHPANHSRANIGSSEPDVGRCEKDTEIECVTIKEERTWDDDIAVDLPPQPMAQVDIKEVPSALEIGQVDDADPLQLVDPGIPDESANQRWSVPRETSVADRVSCLVGDPGETGHACATCGKTFRSVSSLRKHATLHGATKPFRCPDCDSAFARRDYLAKHALVHSGERSWACARCEKTFARRGGLTKHARTHSRDRPFSCDRCDLRFAHRQQLARHLRSLRVDTH